MSSKMWSPTHVQVLVKSAKGLNIKGKNGTNDAFVTIAMGKEKYQTSVKEKATENVDWREQCELSIPEDGNKAEVVLTALHRNFLGVDEFLGVVTISLRDLDVYEKPKSKWYPLKCKSGQKKTDYRGELEVRTSFTVKSVSKEDLSSEKKKSSGYKGSLKSLNKAGGKIGGSLMDIGTKEKKNVKKFAKTVGNKFEKVSEKAKKLTLSKTSLHKDSISEEKHSNPTYSSNTLPNKVKVKDFDLDSSMDAKNSFQRIGSGRNRDPGVQSDDEDDVFKFDTLSHRSSGSSLATNNNLGLVSKTSTPISGSFDNVNVNNDLFKKSFGTPLGPRKESSSNLGTPQMGPKKDSSSNMGTPKSSRSYLLDSDNRGSGRSQKNEQVLDEWEAKLLGKKRAEPYKSPDVDTKSTISQFSQNSQNSQYSATGGRSLADIQPRHKLSNSNLATPQETPQGRKKIIPVISDFEVTPSPESPTSPVNSPISPVKSSETSAPPKFVRNTHLKSHETHDHGDTEKKTNKSIGLKLRNSYSFNQRDDKRLSSSRDLRISSESLGGSNLMVNKSNDDGHSRTQSDASGNLHGSGNLPPSGTRVVLGRETTPTPNCNEGNSQPSRLPKDLWNKFDGKSREDLIEMLINLQDRVEHQAKKQSDLEDYIDSLLTKVIANAPDLLQKNTQMSQRYGRSIK